MAWMETDYSKHTMERRMAAGAFGRSGNYGRDGPMNCGQIKLLWLFAASSKT